MRATGEPYALAARRHDDEYARRLARATETETEIDNPTEETEEPP
jgi:hypothetical protein